MKHQDTQTYKHGHLTMAQQTIHIIYGRLCSNDMRLCNTLR